MLLVNTRSNPPPKYVNSSSIEILIHHWHLLLFTAGNIHCHWRSIYSLEFLLFIFLFSQILTSSSLTVSYIYTLASIYISSWVHFIFQHYLEGYSDVPSEAFTTNNHLIRHNSRIWKSLHFN